MREIKLRVYDAAGKMHYLDTEDTDDALVFRSDCHFDGWLFDGDLVVMQYTGLKDKNGREIYEDDIIEFRDRENDALVLGKIAFDFGQWSVQYLDKNMGTNLSGIPKKVIEVVGNVYEDVKKSSSRD